MGNILSGNDHDGLDLYTGSDLFEGNFVGTDLTGTVAIPNADGILSISSMDTIGGTAAGARNVISGNAYDGLALIAGGSLVEGNLVGTDLTATKTLANKVGIEILGADNTIGGTDGVGLGTSFPATPSTASPITAVRAAPDRGEPHRHRHLRHHGPAQCQMMGS